jgi:hypothetical protein
MIREPVREDRREKVARRDPIKSGNKAPNAGVTPTVENHSVGFRRESIVQKVAGSSAKNLNVVESEARRLLQVVVVPCHKGKNVLRETADRLLEVFDGSGQAEEISRSSTISLLMLAIGTEPGGPRKALAREPTHRQHQTVEKHGAIGQNYA